MTEQDQICRYYRINQGNCCKITETPCVRLEGADKLCPCYNIEPELAGNVFRAIRGRKISALQEQIEASKSSRFFD